MKGIVSRPLVDQTAKGGSAAGKASAASVAPPESASRVRHRRASVASTQRPAAAELARAASVTSIPAASKSASHSVHRKLV